MNHRLFYALLSAVYKESLRDVLVQAVNNVENEADDFLLQLMDHLFKYMRE